MRSAIIGKLQPGGRCQGSLPCLSSRRDGKAELWQAACSLLGEADPAVLIGRERNGALSHADRKE